MPLVDPRHGLGTLVTHAYEQRNAHNAHVTPIYQTSAFIFPDVATGANLFKGEEEGYIYTRLNNPNLQQLAGHEACAITDGAAHRGWSGARCALRKTARLNDVGKVRGIFKSHQRPRGERSAARLMNDAVNADVIERRGGEIRLHLQSPHHHAGLQREQTRIDE